MATERHQWLSLSEMQDQDRAILVDSLMSPSGLLSGAVGAVVGRFQEASKHVAAVCRTAPAKFLMPNHPEAQGHNLHATGGESVPLGAGELLLSD